MYVALHKKAFGVSQYSGPLNPAIESGASYQPPRRAPQLRSAIQKTAELWPGFFAEMQKYAADSEGVNIGQWWEQVGGPHLAKGGDHGEFEQMMQEAGIPSGVQAKFKRVAQEKYPPGHAAPTPARASAMPFGAANPTFTAGLTAAALGAPALYGHFSPAKEDPRTRVPEWHGRLGHYLAGGGMGAALGHSVGTFAGLGSPTAQAIGTGVGALAGAGMGEIAHRAQEEIAQREGARAARTGRDQKLLSEGAKTHAHHIGQAAKGLMLPGLLGSLYAPAALPHALGFGAAAVGSGLAAKRQRAAAVEHYDNALDALDKAAAGAPTRGGFMMASDVPPYKHPRLDRAIQKEGDMLSDYVTYNPGDFKRSKYAMSTGELAAFVAELRKEASALTPAGQLAKTQHVGAPKAAAPPGPSIADIAKPKGAKFGIGIPGAFKTKL